MATDFGGAYIKSRKERKMDKKAKDCLAGLGIAEKNINEMHDSGTHDNQKVLHIWMVIIKSLEYLIKRTL